MAETSTSNQQNIKEVNAITTKSGKILDGHILTTNLSTTESNTEPTIVKIKKKEGEQSKEEAERPHSVKVPFPQALRPAGKNLEGNTEILEHL